eukprot:TRINITY_DN30467_c0_g2_i1.p1 TRINITY_DN30467_c0_g2~~TRINITY_DN30467_c0_g2_i1.p1  ORF type:complete len:503 (+),score=93.21 TRINITY_DN30467_c0_g2_i1:72-1580(+)
MRLPFAGQTTGQRSGGYGGSQSSSSTSSTLSPSSALSRFRWQDAFDRVKQTAAQAADIAITTAQQGAEQARLGAEQVSRTVEAQLAASFAGQFLERPHKGDPLPNGKSVNIRVCSWNLCGAEIDPADDLKKLLMPGGQSADLYVVGIQELVDLGPKSVILGASGDEQRQAALEQRIKAVISANGREYVQLCSFGMVGLSLVAYAELTLLPSLGQIDCDRVKTGLEGLGGNKGGVSIRFLLGVTSVCFVNVHLPSGSGAATERNAALDEILAFSFQGTSRNGTLRPARKGFRRESTFSTVKHDLTIVLGDTNSRLEVKKERQVPGAPSEPEGIPDGPPEAWLLRDEILLGRFPLFRTLKFEEGEIIFPPTYKYFPGKNSLNPKRTPGWCDRILYRWNPRDGSSSKVQLLHYDSCGELMRTSDHHPVTAMFHLEPVNRKDLSKIGSASSGSESASPAAPVQTAARVAAATAAAVPAAAPAAARADVPAAAPDAAPTAANDDAIE